MGSFNFADTGKPIMRQCSDCKKVTPLADGGNDVLCEDCWEQEGRKLTHEDAGHPGTLEACQEQECKP